MLNAPGVLSKVSDPSAIAISPTSVDTSVIVSVYSAHIDSVEAQQ